jgi:hypothetical protein
VLAADDPHAASAAATTATLVKPAGWRSLMATMLVPSTLGAVGRRLGLRYVALA